MVDFWGKLQPNAVVIEKQRRRPEQVVRKAQKLAEHNKPGDQDHEKLNNPTNILRSVLNSSNDFFSGLHTKLNAALSFTDKDAEDGGGSDSFFDEYTATKKPQRDSGGDFGESSTSTSWDQGFEGVGGGESSVCSRKGSRYPRLWMDPTVKRKCYRPKPSSYSVSTSRNEIGNTSEDISSSGCQKVPKRRLKSSSCNVLDSDPVSSNESGSESETRNTDTITGDVDSSSICNSTSEASLLSWSSSLSPESQNDEANAECVEFMRQFVDKLLHNNSKLSLEEKAQFGKLCQTEAGRLWFARFINAQRMNKKVGESTFYSLVQYFAIVIFECSDADDYTPAKSLMNMCFTFYHEVAVPGCEPYKEFLYLYLKDQPIWQSLRFWNAAFFDAVHCERAHRPVVTRKDLERLTSRDITDEKEFQENITFGQLGSFTCNMHAFGLSKELCLEFLRKQSTIADLKPDQITTIKENIELMYSKTQPWRD